MLPIPKRIHFIWLGPRRLPDYAVANIAACRRLHPDYQVEVWTEDRLDFDCHFPKAACVLRQWSRASNYFRMQVLERHGGIYLDTDVEVLRRLDPLLDDDAFAGFQLATFAPDCVNGAVIGSRPGHWFVREARLRLAERMTGAEPVDSSTGPGNVTAVLIEHGLREIADAKTYVDGVAIHPRRAFYPFDWNVRQEDRRTAPDSFTAHGWARSWVPKRRAINRHAEWARSTVPLYWRIDRAVKTLRRSRALLRPVSTMLALHFDLTHGNAQARPAAR